MSQVIFRSDKKKIFLVFIGVTLLTLISLSITICVPFIFKGGFYKIKFLLIILSAVVSITGLIGVVVGIFRLLNSKSNLIVSDEGIRNEVDIYNLGIIPWSNIQRIEIATSGLNKGIKIFLIDKQSYLSKSKSKMMQRGMELVEQKYGTPCFIVTSSLKESVEDIAKVLNEFMVAYKRANK